MLSERAQQLEALNWVRVGDEFCTSGDEPIIYAKPPRMTTSGEALAPDAYVVLNTDGGVLAELTFQQGPPEPNWSGLIEPTLLRVVEHRLQAHQKGPYHCRENALVLTKLQEALLWTMQRVRMRKLRGVFQTSRA